MTSATIKNYPELPIATVDLTIASALNMNAFWDAMAYIVSKYPAIQGKGMMGYTYIANSLVINGSTISGFSGEFLMPNGTGTQASDAIQSIVDHIKKQWPNMIVTSTPGHYPSLYAWYEAHKNTDPVGADVALSSRLLSGEALGQNLSTIRTLLESSVPVATPVNLNLVAGPGTWHAEPAGGSDAVNPAWRKAYLHYGMVDPSKLTYTEVSNTIQWYRQLGLP
jgi:hypothetical protein